MIPVPWRKIKSWDCVECGMCCKDYHVVLNFGEWMNLVRNYGVESTIPTVSKLLLGKKRDGTCCFLNQLRGTHICGLQYMKPLACKIWPFKVFDSPKFGSSAEALFRYRDRDFFVYVDPACTGLHWGRPVSEFKHKILPEFVDVAVGLRKNQLYSTSKIQFRPSRNPFRGRTVI
ncbi:MAG: YkgJ family cysteine cluster protein [Candidatus Bathyarchaeota archaeon]|nr:YkgJ family cysteine cluster protein [Candidatus Bathyarchaeum sp.]